MDISMSNLFKCSLIWSSPAVGEFVLTFLLVAGKELLKAGLSGQHKSVVSHLYFVDDVLVESFFFFWFFSHALPDSAPGWPSLSQSCSCKIKQQPYVPPVSSLHAFTPGRITLCLTSGDPCLSTQAICNLCLTFYLLSCRWWSLSIS